MFVGHLAVALAAKRAEPRLPIGAAVAAAFGLDLIWPLLLLTGHEVVHVNPGDTAFTNLAFEWYPWSHSLLLLVAWSGVAVLIGGVTLRSRRMGWILGLLVASHWLLDLVTHRPDLPLWPGGPLAGLGLWWSVPGTLLVEGALLLVGLALYRSVTQPRDAVGSIALAALVGLCVILWASQPWAPPPPSAAAVAWGTMILWLLPPWSQWAERHRLLRTDVGERDA